MSNGFRMAETKILLTCSRYCVALIVGIYEMTERNTPGVGKVLAESSLASIPEAHCYLRVGPMRVDVTREQANSVEAIHEILYEEEIAPDQIGEYKKNLHRQFLQEWKQSSDLAKAYTLEELWGIRESCIEALEHL